MKFKIMERYHNLWQEQKVLLNQFRCGLSQLLIILDDRWKSYAIARGRKVEHILHML